MAKLPSRAIVRRVEPPPLSSTGLRHDEAFAAVYGPQTYRLKQGTLIGARTEEAGERASACIRACDGLDLVGIQENGIRDLIEAARGAAQLLSGRLVRVDPQADFANQQIKKALRKLGVGTGK